MPQWMPWRRQRFSCKNWSLTHLMPRTKSATRAWQTHPALTVARTWAPELSQTRKNPHEHWCWYALADLEHHLGTIDKSGTKAFMEALQVCQNHLQQGLVAPTGKFSVFGTLFNNYDFHGFVVVYILWKCIDVVSVRFTARSTFCEMATGDRLTVAQIVNPIDLFLQNDYNYNGPNSWVGRNFREFREMHCLQKWRLLL